MEIRPFELERWQSHHEHDVTINLSDSGVHPLSVDQLVPDAEERASLLRTRLGYTQTNGTVELREGIAGMFEGAGPDSVLVTTGGAEANFLAAWSLLRPGDEVVLLQPNYMQLWGIAESMGAECRAWSLRPDLAAGRWVVDLEELDASVNERTRMIAICTPNNPTGAMLDDATLDHIARAAARVGAWVLSDEVYRGNELTEHAAPAPSAWGRYDRVVVTGSLSKSFGLPGLRLGWIVTEPGLVDAAWTRHDYTTIAPAALSDALGRVALRPAVRDRLHARGRQWVRDNCARVAAWVETRSELHWIPPRAGAMAWIRTNVADTAALAEQVRTSASVLIVPGEHYGAPGWIRVGFGGEPDELAEGLERLGAVLDSVG
jgi:aspartate/methionine/tyrosine aminotransferase